MTGREDEALNALFAKQDQARAIEQEIAALQETLENMPGKPGLKGDLIDSEGFPRADVDVHTVRTHRHRVACLQTDHQVLMKEIEQGMLLAYSKLTKDPKDASAAPQPPSGSGNLKAAIVKQDAQTSALPLRPFAVVDEISERSPAATAGLRVGDRVLEFGGLDAAAISARGMAALASVVQNNEGRALKVVVMPEGEAKSSTLQLTPSRWEGRGLLGCHLQPVST
mmetsp:Transcript_3250/g.5237  ORF Transcript_3250/g.5237 Transcript_3250/m.5237 type:complete len:225 (+) Transcript_3250:374-1048(+)|eukprot:CAMPEP_0184313006 /NCGR_PEP_ID=MMETSP1049-20130417/58096_1 /TAXON_ID=77928 /ORGANISM="Proteomonas sulcata, Strain CCMP704" /LENGTH=224 /DNA_ID=CAMNT_0026629807 /DNA_START=300 /DNA_END=974 /DNA_ORIENTATION=+